MNALCIRIQEEKHYETFVSLSRELCSLLERKDARFGHPAARQWQRNRPWRTAPGLVTKIVKSVHPAAPEKVEITVVPADDLFREIRIENTFNDTDGQPVSLQAGAHLDITFEAKQEETTARAADPAI